MLTTIGPAFSRYDERVGVTMAESCSATETLALVTFASNPNMTYGFLSTCSMPNQPLSSPPYNKNDIDYQKIKNIIKATYV